MDNFGSVIDRMNVKLGSEFLNSLRIKTQLPKWLKKSSPSLFMRASIPMLLRSAQRTIVFNPTTDTGYSDTVTIDPRGSDPTLTINRAELAAVLVAVQKGHTEIATDSASSLFQIKKQLLNPVLAVLHHLHRKLLKVR